MSEIILDNLSDDILYLRAKVFSPLLYERLSSDKYTLKCIFESIELSNIEIRNSVKVIDLSESWIDDTDLLLEKIIALLPNCEYVSLLGCPHVGLGSTAFLIRLIQIPLVCINIADTRFGSILRLDLFREIASGNLWSKVIFIENRKSLTSLCGNTL